MFVVSSRFVDASRPTLAKILHALIPDTCRIHKSTTCFLHPKLIGLGMDVLVIVCACNTNAFHGLGIDALVTICSWNTNVVMTWALMHW